jgi:hypothetical protein
LDLRCILEDTMVCTEFGSICLHRHVDATVTVGEMEDGLSTVGVHW